MSWRSDHRLELRYLEDPVKLADSVQMHLRNGREEKVLDLIREASRGIQCTVAWNHVINHEILKGRVNPALKIYNEMKKRAQLPDSYTYLLLLRGLSENASYPTALQKAMTIYRSMSAPSSKVRPTIIHTNAVLKVCARAQDMDALWEIAGKLPDDGPGRPDEWTFTTILNAIRFDALSEPTEGESGTDAQARREKAVLEGRRMWADIEDKWRAMILRIDEELVCAMGQLLLIGVRPTDWDDVLSLVEQTMRVKRQLPRLGSEERPTAEHLKWPADSSSSTAIESSRPNYSGSSESLTVNVDRGSVEEDASPLPRQLFTADPSATAASESPTRRATAILQPKPPTQQTIALLLEACTLLRAKTAATAYWNLLTASRSNGGLGIVPDLSNHVSYLRILRIHRASSAATAHLLDVLLPQYAATMGKESAKSALRKVYIIVMSTLVRDTTKINTLKNAGRVIDAALKNMGPDIKILGMYAGVLEKAKLAQGGKQDIPRRDRGEARQQYVQGCTTLVEEMRHVRTRMLNSKERDNDEKEEALDLAGKICGLLDEVLTPKFGEAFGTPRMEGLVEERRDLEGWIRRCREADNRASGRATRHATEETDRSSGAGNETSSRQTWRTPQRRTQSGDQTRVPKQETRSIDINRDHGSHQRLQLAQAGTSEISFDPRRQRRSIGQAEDINRDHGSHQRLQLAQAGTSETSFDPRRQRRSIGQAENGQQATPRAGHRPSMPPRVTREATNISDVPRRSFSPRYT